MKGSKMKNDYLATGFTDVDNASNSVLFSSCLSLIDSLPYFKAYKEQSYKLLKLRPGKRVLDAGCGLGYDVFRMAELVSPDGLVTGVDASTVLIEKAQQNERGIGLPVEFKKGDLKHLPFDRNTFSCCRVDRVLQHIPEPEKAIAELVRVLESEGLLLAYDNDWCTFAVNSDKYKTNEKLIDFWRSAITNSRIGKELPTLMAEAGLANIQVYSKTYSLTDLDTADEVYALKETMKKAIESKVVTEDEAESWLDDLQAKELNGTFAATLTAYIVLGQK